MHLFFVLYIISYFMHDDFDINKYKNTEIPADLYNEILSRIAHERAIRRLKRRIAFFSACAIGSFSACIPVSSALWSDMSHSGFIQFASLLFSDPFIVITSGSDYLFTLAEALPAFRTSLLLATLLLFFASLKIISQNISQTLDYSHNSYSHR